MRKIFLFPQKNPSIPSRIISSWASFLLDTTLWSVEGSDGYQDDEDNVKYLSSYSKARKQYFWRRSAKSKRCGYPFLRTKFSSLMLNTSRWEERSREESKQNTKWGSQLRTMLANSERKCWNFVPTVSCDVVWE